MSAKPQGSGKRIASATFPVAHHSVQAVQIWSVIGVLLLAIEIYFLAKWAMSDQFVAVPSGPDTPPDWMRVTLITGQVLMTTAWCVTFYWFVIRAWLRDRRLTTDSFIVIGCMLASVWDGLSDASQYWFTYNSFLVNRGSILSVMPTTLSPHIPGANEAWPMLFINTLYGNFVVLVVIACALLRSIKSKWPHIGTVPLVAISVAIGFVADYILEGLILVPLGFWSYAGSHWTINSDTYYKFPLYEAIFGGGGVFGSLICLRYFVDDKGQTLFERGLDKVVASSQKKSFLRATAMLGGILSIVLVTYHIPVTFIALHSTEWPDDVKNRSYFTNGICGPRVNLACPGPTTPIARPGAPRPDFSGRFPQ